MLANGLIVGGSVVNNPGSICGEYPHQDNVLVKYEGYGGLFAHWLEYGHNDMIRRSANLCIETFTKRQPDEAWINKSGKTIFKPAELLKPYRPADRYSPLNYGLYRLRSLLYPFVDAKNPPLLYAFSVNFGSARTGFLLFRTLPKLTGDIVMPILGITRG